MFGEVTISVCVLVRCLIFLYNLFCTVQLNSLHSELANQMADSMVFPLIQFREKDLTGRHTHTHTHKYMTHKLFYHSTFLFCKVFWGYFIPLLLT